MPVPPGAARTEPRYNPWLLVGIAVGTVVALFPLGFGLSLAGLYLLDSLTAQSTGLGVLALFLTALIIPVALLMVPRMKTSTGRSVWMGLALGTAVYLIVGGGLCVALVVGTYP